MCVRPVCVYQLAEPPRTLTLNPFNGLCVEFCQSAACVCTHLLKLLQLFFHCSITFFYTCYKIHLAPVWRPEQTLLTSIVTVLQLNDGRKTCEDELQPLLLLRLNDETNPWKHCVDFRFAAGVRVEGEPRLNHGFQLHPVIERDICWLFSLSLTCVHQPHPQASLSTQIGRQSKMCSRATTCQTCFFLVLEPHKDRRIFHCHKHGAAQKRITLSGQQQSCLAAAHGFHTKPDDAPECVASSVECLEWNLYSVIQCVCLFVVTLFFIGNWFKKYIVNLGCW